MRHHKLSALALAISLVTLIFVIVFGYLYFATSDNSESAEQALTSFIEAGLVEEVEVVEDEFNQIIASYGEYPYLGVYSGVAEVEGYFTTVERPTDFSGESFTTCAAFQVTDGSEEVLDYLENGPVASLPEGIILLGDEGEEFYSPWYHRVNIADSTEEEQVHVVFRFGSVFEGGVVGCFEPRAELIGVLDSSK